MIGFVDDTYNSATLDVLYCLFSSLALNISTYREKHNRQW